MGMYGWLSEQEFKLFSTVSDEDINETLQEVRSVMPEWYVDERIYYTKKWPWSKEKAKYNYTVYQKLLEDSTEVRIQISAQSKATVLNLLYGLYMGYHCGIKTK